MTAVPGKKLHHVSVEVPQIVLYDDLKKKIAEVRVKRDAIMLAHSVINVQQDQYNKCIIILSLSSAFFESTKAQLDLASRKDWISPVSILAPIFLSTVLGIISSLMKFKKFPERMEMLTKATEKGNSTVLQMRRLIENLNFQPYEVSYEEYSNAVTVSYRDALDYYERALYPHEHASYMKQALVLATKVQAQDNEQETAIEALLANQKNRDTTGDTKYPGNVQFGTPLRRSETMPSSPTVGGGRGVPESKRNDSEEAEDDIELTLKRICNACGNMLGRESYSKKAWGLKGKRRCTTCVDAGIEVKAGVSGNNSAAI
jgi:hypothetical protein